MDVLLLETIAPPAAELLSTGATVHLSETPFTGSAIAKHHDIQAIVTRGKGDVSAELIDLCPNLKVIARCGVGLDNVDVVHATERGVRVVNAPGANADTVAEHTLGLMLSLSRRIFAAATAVKDGNWAYRNSYGGDEIRGKTLGIIGYGNIGKKVGLLAKAFGMEVVHSIRAGPRDPLSLVGTTQNPENLARPQVQGEEQKSSGLPLEDVLRSSDILSLHLPLTDETRNLLDASALKRCKPGALIVNTARGEVIDNSALLDALQSEQLGGFAADVLAAEPAAARVSLIGLPNVLVTPHAASLTARTYAHICTLTVENVLKILGGEEVEKLFIANEPTV